MGDITYLEIRNDKKEILDYKYLGIIKYTDKYSLEIYKYVNCMTKLYEKENILHSKLITYCIWTDTIINNIKKLINDSPLDKSDDYEIEMELYNLVLNIINWIDSKLEFYSKQSIPVHILCLTIHNK
jgi:hypothetical protein